MDENAVEVRGLTKRYGSRSVLDSVDFEVHTGETVALLGPNGAGKTTTIEILEGFRRADSGRVRVLGADPQRGDRLWRSRIGIVGQQAGDGALVTVWEYLDYFRRAYPNPLATDEVIARVDLTRQRGTRIGKLSGGQRRRVDVALALVGQPQLVFLDEPTVGFDPEARLQFWELLRRMSGEGVTMLLTSHNFDEVERLADRICVLAGGRIIANGTVTEIAQQSEQLAEASWSEGELRHSQMTALGVSRPTLESSYLRLIRANEGER